MLRENSVLTDFIGFLGFLVSCFFDAGVAYNRGRSVAQSGNLRMVQSGGLGPDSRLTTTARGVQAQVEETDGEKWGPVFLVVAFKGLERLEIGVDLRKTRDCDSMA